MSESQGRVKAVIWRLRGHMMLRLPDRAIRAGCCLVLISLVGGCRTTGDSSVHRSLTRSVESERYVSLTMNIDDVRIKGIEGSEVISAYVEVEEVQKELAERIGVVLTDTEEGFHITVQKPWLWPWQCPEVELTLEVPARMSVSAASASGHVRASGALRGLKVRTRNGSVLVVNCSIEGNCVLRTDNGRVSLRDDAVGEEVYVRTDNGGVDLTRLKVCECTVSTSSGGVVVRHSEIDDLAVWRNSYRQGGPPEI